MKTVSHVCWFTSLNQTIGVIIVINGMQEKRAYIGTCSGLDELLDMKMISEYGAKFSVEAAEILMNEKGQKIDYILTE